MPKKLFLMSASSNSGKTVLANGLLNIAAKRYSRVQFYKALSIDIAPQPTKDGSVVAAYMQEYSLSARSSLRAANNTAYFNPENQTLYCHGLAVTQSKLITRDNIDCDNVNPQVISQIKDQIRQDIEVLSDTADILIAEGGGNCLLGGDHEFSNRWPATEFQFPIVLVAEGRDGGGFLSLLGLKNAMPEKLQKQVAGFVVNGVLEQTPTIDKTISDLSQKTGWPCLGVLPWFHFDEDSSYEEWQNTLETKLYEHARPLLSLLSDL